MTAIRSSFSFQKNFSKKKTNDNFYKLYVEWKGVNKMTVFFATILVSIGVLGRDSKLCY